MPGVPESEEITFALPAILVHEVRAVVAQGISPSPNALACEALERELRRVRSERLRQEYRDAAGDPEFMQDLQESQQAFEHVDAETARMISPG